MNQESKTGDRKGPAQTGQQAPRPGTVFQDPGQHELALTMPAAAPPVDATSGTDSDAAVQILATVRPDAAQKSSQKGPAIGDARPAARPRTGDSFRISRHPVIAKDTNPAWPVTTNPTAGVPPPRPARCWPITRRPCRRRPRRARWPASTPARLPRCRP